MVKCAEIEKVWQSVLKFAKKCKSVQKCVKVGECVQKCTKVRESTKKCAKVCFLLSAKKACLLLIIGFLIAL